MVKRACEGFDKRRPWEKEPTLYTIVPIEQRIQAERNIPEAVRPRNEGVEGPVGGTTIGKVTDMI